MPSIKNIWVTGADGQLGNEFRDLENDFPFFTFHFTSRADLSLTDGDMMSDYLSLHDIDLCINCAAYTAVDHSELDAENAFAVNAQAPGLLAEMCMEREIKLVHFSTDYVFNGNGTEPYQPGDETDPVNAYGASKLGGEKNIMSSGASALIIRTSWVYSTHGKNFVKTMLRLMAEKDRISVVNDQFGSPTYAADLALAVLRIAEADSFVPGIYHYCNVGIISWYDFALAIKELSRSSCAVEPIPTSMFPTPAKRPQYSALETQSFISQFGLNISPWKDSLAICLEKSGQLNNS